MQFQQKRLPLEPIMQNKELKIGVLCHYPFPKGMAATTRIIAYGKGLQEQGVKAYAEKIEYILDNYSMAIKAIHNLEL